MESPYVFDRPAELPRSLWAAVTPDVPARLPLQGNTRCDVVVVGAGFMGLSAALCLAEAGAKVIVVEAAKVGWGASGRNNGLIAPGLKRDPHEVRHVLGNERADRLLRFSGEAPGRLFELIDRLNISCDVNDQGWIQAAHAPSAIPLIERRVSEWRALDADVSLIPRQDVAERLGTEYYVGAWIDRRGGSLNPLAYVRGLAAAALKAGAQVFESTPALGIDRAGSTWHLQTPGGAVIANAVLCCTNAYNHGIAPLRATVIPLRTAQVASQPLGDEQVRSILPGGESASDTQRLLTSFRITADRRLIMGGASATAGDETPGLMRHLHKAARERFPTLGDIDWRFGWSGYLALTHDHLPRIFKPADGFYAGIACNGRGIAMATSVGEVLAGIVLGDSETESAVPVCSIRRVIGYSFRHPGVAAGVLLNRVCDQAERRLGRRAASI